MSVEAVDSVLRVYPDKSVRILRDLIDFPAAEDSVKSDKTFRLAVRKGRIARKNTIVNLPRNIMWSLSDVKGSHILNMVYPNIGKKSWKSIKYLAGNDIFSTFFV